MAYLGRYFYWIERVECHSARQTLWFWNFMTKSVVFSIKRCCGGWLPRRWEYGWRHSKITTWTPGWTVSSFKSYFSDLREKSEKLDWVRNTSQNNLGTQPVHLREFWKLTRVLGVCEGSSGTSAPIWFYVPLWNFIFSNFAFRIV